MVTGNDYESLTRTDPLDIVDHVLENGDELSLAATEDLHILQTVLAVVALT